MTSKSPSTLRIWRFNNQLTTIPHGKTLRLELEAAASVHWSTNQWQDAADVVTRESGLGTHFVDLDTSSLDADQSVVFTFLWTDVDRWENADFTVQLVGK